MTSHHQSTEHTSSACMRVSFVAVLLRIILLRLAYYLPIRANVPPPSSFFPAKLLTCGKAVSPMQMCLMGGNSSLEALWKAQGCLSIEHRAWSEYSDASHNRH